MEGELILKTGCYVPTLKGLQVTRDSTPEEWKSFGKKIGLYEDKKQWIVGDWLADGKQHYGDGMYNEAAEATGLSESTLQTYKSISGKIETCNRLQDLSWKHHETASSIKKISENGDGKLKLSEDADQDKIAEFLAEAEKDGLSVVAMRNKIRDYKEWQRQEIAAANEPEKYAIIYADPPWQYNSGDQHTDEEQETVLGDHYPSMSLGDICALPQAKLAATDCVLFLWCTSPTLEEALQVINAWGFKYKASMVWDKVAHNVGHYVSVRHELLLIATKGQPPKVPKLVDSVYSEERTEHSKKPKYFRELIGALYPEGKRIEFFCRGLGGPGWDAWGNEACESTE